MWLIDFLFGKKQHSGETQASQDSDANAVQAPGTRIAYSSDLVPQLKEDHRRLLETFGLINTAFSRNDLVSTAKYLEDFRGGVLAHLLTENIRFYIYLEHAFAQDLESFNLMHGFRQEMDTIGKAVLAFLTKYKDIDTQPNLAVSFGKDLENVGGILSERIKREEETLYPLYLPSY